jgi:dienelactone hydrolase
VLKIPAFGNTQTVVRYGDRPQQYDSKFNEMNRLNILFCFLLYSAVAIGQSKTQLPIPTGSFEIGTFTTEIQTKIQDPFSIRTNSFLKLPIQFWYPAVNDTVRLSAKYSPLFKETDSVFTNSFYNRQFTNLVMKAPVVLICIGRGMTKHEYSIISEELASQGYIVASIDLPYIGTTKLLDGNLIKASQTFRLPPGMLGGPYEKVDSFFTTASALGAEYLNETINYIVSQNKTGTSPFYGKIDINNFGVFGHSLGGRVAGQLIAENKRVRAYISMEGIAPRNIRMNGVEKPMAYMLSDGIVKNAIANYEQAIPNRKSDVYIIVLKDFGHNSFTDYPVIAKSSANYKVEVSESTRITRKLLTSYFDMYLKSKGSFESNLTNETLIELKKYPKQ